jgi:hypothetical protein
LGPIVLPLIKEVLERTSLRAVGEFATAGNRSDSTEYCVFNRIGNRITKIGAPLTDLRRKRARSETASPRDARNTA